MKQPEVINEHDDHAYMHYLPPHLRERYVEGLRDATLTHLQRQIALMDIRIKGLLEVLDQQVLTEEQIAHDLRTDFPDLPELDVKHLTKFVMSYLPDDFINYKTFKKLSRIIERMDNAQLDGRIREADRCKKMLFNTIFEGKRDGDVWEDIIATMESRRRLVEAEERRRANTEQTMSLQQVVMLASLLIEACKESVMKYVNDREVQQLILRDTERSYAKQIGLGDSWKAD